MKGNPGGWPAPAALTTWRSGATFARWLSVYCPAGRDAAQPAAHTNSKAAAIFRMGSRRRGTTVGNNGTIRVGCRAEVKLLSALLLRSLPAGDQAERR